MGSTALQGEAEDVLHLGLCTLARQGQHKARARLLAACQGAAAHAVGLPQKALLEPKSETLNSSIVMISPLASKAIMTKHFQL